MKSGLQIAPAFVAVLLVACGSANGEATYDEVLSVIPDTYVTVIGTGDFDAFVEEFLGERSHLAEIAPAYQETVRAAFEEGLYENLGPGVMEAIDRSGGFAVAFMQQAVPAFANPMAYIVAVTDFEAFIDAFKEAASTGEASPEVERIDKNMVRLSMKSGDTNGTVYIIRRGRYAVVVAQDEVTAKRFHAGGATMLGGISDDEKAALAEARGFVIFNAKAYFTDKKVQAIRAALARPPKAASDGDNQASDPVTQCYAGLVGNLVGLAAQIERVTAAVRTDDAGFVGKGVVTFQADSEMAGFSAAQKEGELKELELLPPETAYAVALDVEATDGLRAMVSSAVEAFSKPVLGADRENRFLTAAGNWISAFRFKGVIGFALPKRKLTHGAFRSLGALEVTDAFTAETFRETYGAAAALLGALGRPLTLTYTEGVTTRGDVTVNRIAGSFDFPKNSPGQVVAETKAFYGQDGPVVDYALTAGRLLYTLGAPYTPAEETAPSGETGPSEAPEEETEVVKVKLSLIEKLIDLTSGEGERFIDSAAFRNLAESTLTGANVAVVTDLPRYGWLLLKGTGAISEGLDEYNPFWDLQMPEPSEELCALTVRFRGRTAHIDVSLPATQIGAFKEMFVRAVGRIR